MQKSHATSELTIKILNHLHFCIWYGKLSIASRCIFPSPSCPMITISAASNNFTAAQVQTSLCQVAWNEDINTEIRPSNGKLLMQINDVH